MVIRKRSERTTRHLLYPEDDPEYDDSTNNSSRKLETRRAAAIHWFLIETRRLNSSSSHPTPKAMNISEAKGALDMEWTNLQKLPAWSESKVTSKAEMIRKAKLQC